MRPQKLIVTTLFFFLTITLFGQDSNSIDFTDLIIKSDISRLFRAGSIYRQDDNDKVEFPEPLGFIGENYQRFFIHYTSVIKDKNIPNRYSIIGKTKVNSNICNFIGTITITKARLLNKSYNKNYRQGFFISELLLYEDSVPKHSGFIKGTLTTNFCIDKNKKIYYDAIMSNSDSFSNNQCIAKWTDYKTKKSKVCNWGDFRIPNSQNLDIGAGDFSVAEKYLKFGWTNYRLAYSDQKKSEEALKIERQKWWK